MGLLQLLKKREQEIEQEELESEPEVDQSLTNYVQLIVSHSNGDDIDEDLAIETLRSAGKSTDDFELDSAALKTFRRKETVLHDLQIKKDRIQLARAELEKIIATEFSGIWASKSKLSPRLSTKFFSI